MTLVAKPIKVEGSPVVCPSVRSRGFALPTTNTKSSNIKEMEKLTSFILKFGKRPAGLGIIQDPEKIVRVSEHNNFKMATLVSPKFNFRHTNLP